MASIKTFEPFPRSASEEEGGLCIYRSHAYVIVPTNREQPCLGPFHCNDSASFQILQGYIKDELGLSEGEYDLRDLVEVPSEFLEEL